MPNLYALNMTADLSNDTTGYFSPYSSNSNMTSRAWVVSSNNGQTWSACNSGNNNSDIWSPTLQYSRSGRGPTDSVQFAVFVPLGVSAQSPQILVTFGIKGDANIPNAVASPFQNGNNVKAILGIGSTPSTYQNATQKAYYIGPFSISVNQQGVPAGIMKFQFAMAATFTVNGNVYTYGYDPEMDVDIGT